MATWDPTQYLKFADHRLRPALDLIARIPAEQPARVVDLGCGAGNVTRHLRRRWPAADVIGVDGSSAMLAKARADAPDTVWIEADIAAWAPERPVDVVFSNAALHWLGDHERLFPRLMAALAPGGVLAVQMPRNFDAPSHTLMAEAAAAGPWRDRVIPLLRPRPVAEPAVYYRSLRPLATGIDLWETVYIQALEGDDPVAEWTKGTWLKALLDALDEPEKSAFEADYRARVRRAYPKEPDGRTLFPFRRLFLVATR